MSSEGGLQQLRTPLREEEESLARESNQGSRPIRKAITVWPTLALALTVLGIVACDIWAGLTRRDSHSSDSIHGLILEPPVRRGL